MTTEPSQPVDFLRQIILEDNKTGKFGGRVAAVEPFESPTIEAAMHGFIEAEGIKIGDIIHAVRVAVTGTAVGLGMFDTLAIVGRSGCLARMSLALGRI
jgi:glutamyl-tRNA synthetase